MRDYGVVKTRFWVWAKRKKISPEAKEMALYLLTCEHANSLGCFRLPIAYVCDDLGAPAKAACKALAELVDVEFIHRDSESGWTWIVDYLQHNPVPNGKVGKAIGKLLDQVPAALPFHAALAAELFNHEHVDHDMLQKLAAKRLTQDTVSATQDTVSKTQEPITQTPTPIPNHDPTHTPAAAAPDPGAAYQMFIDAAKRHGWVEARGLDPDRRKKLIARLAEHGANGWAAMIERAGQSEFLRTEFRLKLDWVLEPKNFRKVIEGNYDNKGKAPAKSFAQQRQDAAVTVADRDGADQWRARMRQWRKSQFWLPHEYGPEPGQSGCRVPAALVSDA